MREELEESRKLSASYLPCPKKRGKFFNPHIKNIRRRLWDYLLWQSGKYDKENTLPKAPMDFCYPNPAALVDDKGSWVRWINHSSFYLSYQGVRFFTDPIFSKRCSPVKFVGPRRLHDPCVSEEDLIAADYVLISHDHYDHLDKSSVLEIIKANPFVFFIVPEGVKKRFFKWGITNVIEVSWWESHEFYVKKDLKIRITAVPSQHFSGRGLFDGNSTLWCGYVVQFFHGLALDKQFYFVGDTGYNPFDFQSIGQAFGEMDLSLIPIGTYIPFTFMSPVHICPTKAVAIHQEVKSKLSVGMHWRTFKLSDEGLMQPPYDLYLAMKDANLDPLAFRVLDPGQCINW